MSVLFSILIRILMIAVTIDGQKQQQQPKQPQHTSNYAVIVSTSRYYFNYRHSANALSIYNLLKTRGKFPDSNIILMLAEDYAYDARNPFKNTLYTESNAYNDPSKNLAPHTTIEVDYSGDEVNIDSFRRVLLGRHEEGELNSRKLPRLTNSSNIFIFMTGHGGDTFFKFHDLEEISTPDFQSIFQQMHVLQRYNSILFITDTCQAFTLSEGIEDVAPNVISIGSSLRDENSYAHHSDRTLGVSVIDRFSFHFTSFLSSQTKDWEKTSLNQVVKSMTWGSLRSNVGIRGKVNGRGPHAVKVSEFLEDIRFKKLLNKNQKLVNEQDNFISRKVGWDERTDLKIVPKIDQDDADVDMCEDVALISEKQSTNNKEKASDNKVKNTTSWTDFKMMMVLSAFVFTVRYSSNHW